MLGTSGRQTQTNPLNEEVKELSMRFFRARESCGEESLRLLHTNQRFLKRLEDAKRAKEEIENRKNNYIDQATVFALRDAELRYQKACMLDTEREWAEMISNRHEEIKTFRSDLEKQLQHYCEERRKTAAVQTKVTNRTEEDRINALNTVAFCTYAQTIVEGEVKKLCASANLPTTRNIQKIQSITNKATKDAKAELQSYYEDRIKEFKRQERILFGRGRDASEGAPRSLLRPAESSSGNDGNASNPVTNNNGSNNVSGSNSGNSGTNPSDITAEMLIDTIENRIATKLVVTAFDTSHNISNHNRPDSYLYDDDDVHSPRQNTLTPVPPNALMSSSGKSGGRRAKQPPSLRASDLAQHQQQMMSQSANINQQQQQQGHTYNPRSNRRFSLLQNGDLIPAVSSSMTTDGKQQTNKGKSSTLTAPLASATMTGSSATPNAKNVALSSTKPNPAGGNNNANNAHPKKNKKGSKKGNSGDNEVLYDPHKYAAACNAEYVKSHALLDLTAPGIADREEKLIQLGLLTCEARGKMAHLNSLRNSLDGLLTRQLICLMTVLHHNQPMPVLATSAAAQMLINATNQPVQTLIDHHLIVPKSATTDYDEIFDSYDPNAYYLHGAASEEEGGVDFTADTPVNPSSSFHQYSSSSSSKKKVTLSQFKKLPLQLSAANKIVQLDCAQKEQDIHALRDRIVLLLQRPSDSPPATARNASQGREPAILYNT